MEKTNLENLNKLAKLFGTDRLISPEEIQEIRGVLVGVLANNKKEVESLTAETRELVNKVLNKVLDEHDTYLEKSKQIAQEAKSDTTEAIQATMKSLEEVKKLCKEVMDCKPENGKDADEEYVIGEVLNRIKLPEYKEVVLDDGGAIVDKINSLPVNEENQIDAKHIKNLPEVKGGRVISGGVTRKIVEQMIAATSSGSPGGSTTQLQYNNAGAFGGISGATTNGTAVTYTAGNLIAADITASGSGGFLIDSNSGTDVALFGAGGGAGATFYGGVNVEGTLTVLGQGGTGGMVTGNASIGAGYTGVSLSGTLTSSNYNFGGGTGDVNLYINRPTGGKIFFRENNATARVTFSASGLNGFETTAPTHTLTLGSTSTGIALYNTADQTTNYERFRSFWSGDTMYLRTEQGGTGTLRGIIFSSGDMRIQAADQLFLQNDVTECNVEIGVGGTRIVTYLNRSTHNQSSSTAYPVLITPTINQTGTAGYTAFHVDVTQTATGSGTKLLADFQVGGTSKHKIFNDGVTHFIMPDTSTSIFSTVSNSPGGTTGIEFRYNSVGGATNIARIMAVVGSGGGGDINFDTAAGGGSAYSTKATITRAGNFYVSGTLELGSTTDTTISRSSAGVIAVEGVVIPSISSTNTLTNKRITSRVQAVTSSATVTPSWDNDDAVTITAQAAGLTLANPSGTPTSMQRMVIRIKDNGTAQTIAYGAGYRAIGVTLPTTTVISKTLYLGGFWNAADSKFDITAYAQEA